MKKVNYKKINLTIVGLILCVFISLPAWSLTIDGGETEVGNVDPIVSKISLKNSSESEEMLWVEEVLGEAVNLSYKNDGNFDWNLVDDKSTIYVQDLETTTEYYLIKTGNIKNGYTHFLFDNLSDLSYAVIDLTDLGTNLKNINIGKVSHIAEFSNYTPAPAPEPSTMLLWGIGFVGFAGVYRKKI